MKYIHAPLAVKFFFYVVLDRTYAFCSARIKKNICLYTVYLKDLTYTVLYSILFLYYTSVDLLLTVRDPGSCQRRIANIYTWVTDGGSAHGVSPIPNHPDYLDIK